MLYVVYCHIDELLTFEPKNASDLQKSRFMRQGPYSYKLGKTGYVTRIVTELEQYLLAHHISEKHKPYDPKQRCLQL